jgi:hypothetical protein
VAFLAVVELELMARQVLEANFLTVHPFMALMQWVVVKVVQAQLVILVRLHSDSVVAPVLQVAVVVVV